MQSKQSIELLLNYLFNELNDYTYIKIITMDLRTLLMSTTNSNLVGTFSEDKDESKVLNRNENCNFEIFISDTEL